MMPTRYSCEQGHLWEDLFDAPSLVDGEVRCPECGQPSHPLSDNQIEAPSATQEVSLSPVKVSAPAGFGSTRLLPSATPSTDPGPTTIRPALANMTPAVDGLSIDAGIGLQSQALTEDLAENTPVLPSRKIPSPASTTKPESAQATTETSILKGAPTIPGYEIVGELGRGGMGVVYKARQVGLNRLVALKMILAGSQADERDRARFRTEADAIARLQHPNIVQIFEVGEHEGSAWFSLEFVDGGSLADRLTGKPLPLGEAASLIETLSRAMHFAHEHGVVHRDLKPANVLLQRESSERRGGTPPVGESDSSVALARVVPKITDFGLAKTLDANIHHTRSGMVVGTPGYMAPEQATGSENIGPATDTYALGVLLYQLVTGRLPFVGETPMDVMIKVTQEEPPRPSRWLPHIPRDMETVILKCLEKDPQRRYSSALALAEDLQRFLSHEPVLARPVGRIERVSRWMRRNRAMAIVTGTIAITVLSLLTMWGVQTRAERLHVAGERDEILSILKSAEDQAAVSAWKEVLVLLEETRPRVRKGPEYADLIEPIDHLYARAKGHVARNDVVTAFRKARDEALFHATLASGTGSLAQAEMTREKVDRALATVQASSRKLPTLDEYYSSAEKSEIQRGCFELLLELADAIAVPMAGKTSEIRARNQNSALEALKILEQAARLGFSTHAYHLRRARFLRQADKKEEAARESNLAKDRPPKDDLDFYLVGSELYRQGDSANAESAFSKALLIKPGHFWAWFYLALCQIKQGQFTQARDNLTSCLQQQQQVHIYLLRGFVLGQLGQFSDAETDFKAAEERLGSPADPVLQYALHNNRAVTYVGLKEFPKAHAALSRAIEMSRNDYRAYVTRAQIYRDESREIKADSQATPEALRTVKEQRKAKLDSARGALDQAVELARAQHQREELDNNTLMLLYRLRSRLNLEREDRDAAAADLEAINKLQGVDRKTQARSFRDQGHLLYRAGRYALAQAAYEQAIALTPNEAEPHRWLGEVLLRNKEYSDAILAFDRYVELKGPAELNVFRGRAIAHLHLKEYELAIRDLTQALAIRRNDADLHIYRGKTYLECKAWPLAVKDFDQAIEIAPSVAGYQGRGLARMQLGQVKEAAQDAEELVRLGKGASRPLYDASCLLAQVAGQIEPSRSSTQDAARRERAAYQKRAVALLQQSLETMPQTQRYTFWRETIQRESALRPLTNHPDYLRLERRYSTPPPPRTEHP
jgi:serine/threonine protein kinase/lipoprotein NlpI